MPGRRWESSPDDYRYSHNGQEKEDAIFEGALSSENWMYDSRLLRRWEMDPMASDYQSPYACFDGNPIALSDPDGLWGDPPGTVTKNTQVKPELGKGNTALDIQVKNIEKGFVKRSATKKFLSFAGEKLLQGLEWTLSKPFVILSLLDNSDGYGKGSVPYQNFKPLEKITLDPSKLTSQYLLDVKARVEMGKGSFNDHQIYNKTFVPTVQGPFKTQSHHVIPVAVFEDITGSELVATAMQDADFKKWANKSDMNRIPLGDDVHGNHPAYSDYVRGEIKALELQYGGVDSKTAAKLLEQLAGRLKGEITNRLQQNPGKRLNEVFGGGKSKKSSGSSKPKSKSTASF